MDAQWYRDNCLSGDEGEDDERWDVADFYGVDIDAVTEQMIRNYRWEQQDMEAWNRALAPATSAYGDYKIWSGR